MAKQPPRKPTTPLLRENDALLRGQRRRERDPAQPQLPFDPFPDWVEPCLAKLVQAAPEGAKWAYEIKWDGYRVSVAKNGSTVRVITRGGHEWTDRFPTIASAARDLPVSSVILDGEAVVLDAAGRSDFAALRQALGGRGGKRSAESAMMMVFDVLYFDGHDLRKLDLDDRRQILEDLVPPAADGGLRLSQEIEGDGPAIFKAACVHGLEGVIAKDRGKPYRSGRGGEWLKIKCVQSDSFAIIGYERSAAGFGGIGRLMLAARRGDKLQYVGGVGTGFNAASATALRRQMDKLVVPKPAADVGRKKRPHAVWTTPTLVAEIEYRGWTADEKLRHSSYKGLREDADAADVHELE